MKERIILFGGSFDPIHEGHISIAKNAKEVLNCNRVIFIPAKNPRWKKGVTPTKDRLEMLKRGISGHSDFTISNFEINSNARVNYSIDTIRYFSSLYKGSELFFLIGYDQLNRLHEWKDIDEIIKLVHIVAVVRPNAPLNIKNKNKYNVMVIDNISYYISSTDIRTLKKIDVPISVLEYIHDNNLYFLKEISQMLSKRRFEHCKSVAMLCYKIALNNDLDRFKCYVSGLLHDIGKEVDKVEEEEIMNSFFKEYYLSLPEFSYHQFVGSYLVQTKFKIEDEEVIEAVKFHATGKGNMSSIGKVVYASDKIEPLRGFDSTDLIASCLKDYEQGFIDVLTANIEFLKEHHKSFENILTKECIAYYLK